MNLKIKNYYIIILILIWFSCQNRVEHKKIYLKKFNNAYLEELDFNLGLFDTFHVKIEQQKYYSSFWVESLPIIWWFILLGFDKIYQ